MLSAGHMRRRWAGILAVLIVCVSASGILAALGSHMKRREAVLDGRGRRTMAVVVSVDDRFRRADTATLRFEYQGREYDAETTVGDIDDFPVGSTREIIYDPAHPTHARPVKGWSPTYDSFFITAFMLLVAGLAHSARRSVSTVLAKRVEGQTVLRVETFQMRRWWQRWAKQWAGLWPVDADPTSEDATLYVPIENVDKKHAIGFEEPTTVLGELAPGRLVLLVRGDQVVWPRGRATGRPPRGAELTGRVQHSGDPW